MKTTQCPVTRGQATALDTVLVEAPLEIRVDQTALAVTMRTPGEDLDLAVGFLRTEGVIDDVDDLSALAQLEDNVVDCRLASGAPGHLTQAARVQFATSSCGLCGKQSLDRVRLMARQPLTQWAPTDALVSVLPASLRAAMPTFQSTGGCHGAALVDSTGRLLFVREDIGRHNAVDKVIGAALRDGQELGQLLLCVSSRISFEIVQKARLATVPAIVALGAASSLAVELAKEEGLSLIGFAREQSNTRYC